jgi:hypothetical protein
MAPESDTQDTYQPLTLLQFGIELRRMVETDKEIVRLGRNEDFGRENHVYRKIISETEQDNWFNEMNRKEHVDFHSWRIGQAIGGAVRLAVLDLYPWPDSNRHGIAAPGF